LDLIKTLLPPGAQVVSLTTNDGVKLAGYYIKANYTEADGSGADGSGASGTKRLTIIIHGLGRSFLSMADRWNAVYPHLGSVLFLDLRGHGRSSRRALITFGDNEALDVKAAVDRFRDEYNTIVLWGHSMGAAASLKYTGGGGKPDGLILEAMYHSFDDAIDTRANIWRAPKTTVVPLVKFLFRHVMRIDFEGLCMPRILEKINGVPTLLVQSREDEKVPMASFEKLKAALGDKGRSVVFDQGDHDSIFRTNREEYIKLAGEFIGSIGN